LATFSYTLYTPYHIIRIFYDFLRITFLTFFSRVNAWLDMLKMHLGFQALI
jgi:hypothetical protein